MLKEFLTTFLRDEGGQDVVEYSLLLTLIGATSLMILTAAGINVGRLFQQTFSLAHHTEVRLGAPTDR
jgi:Flp pilus assembly pilin Flp